ncbi:MAG: DUF951 domain-containing protein [Chloroflexi bacterium]|nr:DUF951 domain-containing protein [Chloroflexota bacterium]
MRPAKLTPFQPGDRITLKKPHPCGGREWDVYRIGADIGLHCLTCGRRFMLPRREVERRMKARVPASPSLQPSPNTRDADRPATKGEADGTASSPSDESGTHNFSLTPRESGG